MTGLNSAGYAILPSEKLLPADIQQNLLNEASEPRELVRIFTEESGWTGDGGIQAVTDRLLSELRAALPQENIHLRDIEVRNLRGKKEIASFPHYDLTYLTAIFVLQGPPTILFEFTGDRIKRTTVGPNVLFIINGIHREAATGHSAAIHSAPLRTLERRVTLLWRFNGSSLDARSSKQADARVNRVIEWLKLEGSKGKRSRRAR